MLIGLTGQIGAGKTTAAEILTSLGALVIDADEIGRQVVDESSVLRKKLARRFGADILDGSGRLKRKKLARIAFADQAARAALNQLIHPYLLKELRRQVRIGRKTHDLIVIDAALLLEWRMDKDVDFVLVIHAGQTLRFTRLANRGLTRADALARQRMQLPFGEFKERADRVILNNGNEAILRRKIAALLHSII